MGHPAVKKASGRRFAWGRFYIVQKFDRGIATENLGFVLVGPRIGRFSSFWGPKEGAPGDQCVVRAPGALARGSWFGLVWAQWSQSSVRRPLARAAHERWTAHDRMFMIRKDGLRGR